MRYVPNGQTYGVRVDRADYANDSDTVDGLHANSFIQNSSAGDFQIASSTNGQNSYPYASLELRESNYGGNGGYTSPRLAFHWG